MRIRVARADGDVLDGSFARCTADPLRADPANDI